jgi:NAD(P)-dependent dehydrogenase (short-subunit alcohol dehydrogenase family)
MAKTYSRTEDGFEIHFGTNHIGHFLLFQLLKPTLLKSSTPSFNSRVVSVSSFGHRSCSIRFDDNFDWKNGEGYEPKEAYGQSKTANIYLASEIDRRYGSKGLHATSLHPGGIITALQHVPEEQKKAWNVPDVIRYMKSVEQGAATTVYAAISHEWEGKGGKYLSDCVVQEPFKGGSPLYDDGYAAWIYDCEKEGKLWKESMRLIGMEDNQQASQGEVSD